MTVTKAVVDVVGGADIGKRYPDLIDINATNATKLDASADATRQPQFRGVEP